MKQSFNAKQKVCTSRYNNGRNEFYCSIYTSTVEDWDNNDLSREAVFMLLQLSTGIKEGYEWTVYQSQVNGNVFPDADSFNRAFAELESKGYARRENGILFIRNDRRANFSAITPVSSSSWNKKEEEYTPEWKKNGDFDKLPTLEERYKDLERW